MSFSTVKRTKINTELWSIGTQVQAKYLITNHVCRGMGNIQTEKLA